MIASQPLEGYVSRVVSGVMAAIAAYWAMRLMSPLWTVLAVLVGWSGLWTTEPRRFGGSILRSIWAARRSSSGITGAPLESPAICPG